MAAPARLRPEPDFASRHRAARVAPRPDIPAMRSHGGLDPRVAIRRPRNIGRRRKVHVLTDGFRPLIQSCFHPSVISGQATQVDRAAAGAELAMTSRVAETLWDR